MSIRTLTDIIGGHEMIQMILRLRAEMRNDLKNAADARGQTLTGLIRQILWEWLKNQDEK